MGTNAKLMIKSTKDKLYIYRKYNVQNNMLTLMNLEEWICSHGLPVYILKEVIMQMQGMFFNESKYELYKGILDWLNKFDEYEYVILIDEHQDEYYE